VGFSKCIDSSLLICYLVLHAGRKTWHTSVVLAGSVILCSVGYVLYTDLSGKSIARQGFHQALECIQAHPSVCSFWIPLYVYTTHLDWIRYYTC
jgi:hypothetical protein